MASELALSARWDGPGDAFPRAQKRRAAVLAELIREVAPDHALWGRLRRVEAFFEASDDVIVLLDDGSYALVHPTWTLAPERPPCPTTDFLGSAAQATEAVREWEQSWSD